MFKNYIKVAFRNILKTKFFSLINIAGLAIGIAVTLMILMYVTNELSYENFHKKRKQIYRISVAFGQEHSMMRFAGAMPALGPALIEEMPEVLNSVRFEQDVYPMLEYDGKKFHEQNFFYADPSIFDVFSFSLIKGNKETALHDPFSMVITQEIAEKYFGIEDPIGKTVIYNSEYPIQITGVIKDIPANTHLKCNFLVSYSSLEPLGRVPESPWNVFGDTYTYLLLKKGTSASELEGKMQSLLERNTSPDFARMNDLGLLKLTDIHMKSRAIVDLAPKGNMTYVYVFSSVAFLILLIACFNFINLSTARSLKRMKEVGMRRTLGARRSQIIKQLLGESILITLFAVALAVFLFELFYPVLNDFLENSLSIAHQNFRNLIVLVPIIAIIVGILAGSYPSFYLSRYRPIQALSDKLAPISSRSSLRKILVVSQFTMAIVLIIGTIVIFRQLDFMKNSDLGFKKENAVILNFRPKNPQFKGKYSVLTDQFQRHPQVVSAAGAYTIPGRFSKETKTIWKETGPSAQKFSIQAIAVDFDYVQSMGMDIVEGRSFSRDYAADERGGMLLNEQAVKQLNLSDPVGDKFKVPGSGGAKEMTVLGIVKDFHVYSLKQKIEPLMLYINPDYFYTIAVRIRPENTQATIAYLEETWKNILPDTTFNYTFLEDAYHQLYIAEEKVSQLLTLFSGLAIFVACLGLFGLASFMAVQRHKEIGIRKVLGADISRIMFLLSKDFTKNVLIANILSWPLAYFAMTRWLQNYAYRINIGIWPYLAAGGGVLLTALLTVGYQAIKASLADPVDSLRYE
jgi:putative ABC transport system permease protein